MDLKCYNVPQTILENEYLLLQDLFTKGDDIQKLSVIQALPQLLQYDPNNGTLTRIIPKIQQELSKSSCEFHIATSKIFQLLIEKQLPFDLTGAVVQGTESKDPVVSNAWTETLLAVIPILEIDQIKSAVIPLALSKSQLSSSVFNRVASCRIFGKCAAHPKIQSIDVKTSILPSVQSLCQDCVQDVRATMCSHLHLVAQGLGVDLVKTSLLPSLVELASDDNMVVRSSAVASAVSIIPYLNKQTKTETIVPLIKQLCAKTLDPGDLSFLTVAREFGKLADTLKSDLQVSDSLWMLNFYKCLASKGRMVVLNTDNLSATQADALCREQCALNLPSVTLFVTKCIPHELELWHSVLNDLVSDSCYLVRKSTACCIFEVAKILGKHCTIITDDIIKLLCDDEEEVLKMLVPQIGPLLEFLHSHGLLSREKNLPSCLEITKALLKCHVELSKKYNWRMRSDFLQQLERLPNCMPSDFIHQHFSPVILNSILESRPKPVRSQATRTLLVFLRYNLKESQRKWIRDSLINQLCYSLSCYTRQIFIVACGHAAEIFSNSYFKKFFFEPLLSLADDPVSNIRLSVVGLLPGLYKMLVFPKDRKLQAIIDNIVSKLDIIEEDRDVKEALKHKVKEIRNYGTSNSQEYLIEQRRKEDEEDRIGQGRSLSLANVPSVSSLSEEASNSKKSQPLITKSTISPRISKSQGPLSSDMSFLEQHFYIDAGISLPRRSLERVDKVDISQLCEQFEHQINLNKSDSSVISTVSVENVDVETLSETELKQLETSTTNITDDIKVDLRKRSKRNTSQLTLAHTNVKGKRYSNIFPVSSFDNVVHKKNLNRRSLNIGSGDMSKIPVCIKKSQSIADVKNETKATSSSSGIRFSSFKNRNRPKSEVLTSINNNRSTEVEVEVGATSSNVIQSDIPTTSALVTNKVTKTSSLPVLKRRTQTEIKNK